MTARVFSRLGKGAGKTITLKGIKRLNKCSWCGAEDVKTHFHHKSKDPQDVVEVCEDCHQIRHSAPAFLRDMIRSALR